MAARALAVVGVFCALVVAGASAASPDLIQNGSFEGSLSGWAAFGGSAALATDGAVGTYAAKITGTTSPFGLYPTYWPVTNAVAGDSYTSTAWVRTDTLGPYACVRIREWNSSVTTVVGLVNGCVTLARGWQQLTATYTVKTSGDLVETYVLAGNAISGNSFETDGVSMIKTGAAATPPDTTITSGPPAATTSTSASFAFTSNVAGSTFQCALDGAAFAVCASPATYGALAVGSHTFTVRAVDSAGNVDPTPASQTWQVQASSSDLLQNGSFEGSLSGWAAFAGTAALAADGAVGSYAAKITASTTPFGLYQTSWPVPYTAAGDSYTSTAWFRTDTTGPYACVRIREWNAAVTAVVDQINGCVTLARGWQQVTATYTVKNTGDRVEAYVLAGNAVAGNSFEADGVTLRKNTPDPLFLAAGDIASCSSTWDSATAALLQRWPDAVVATLGDNAYPDGSTADFSQCYDPTWGAVKARTHPSTGNHEYLAPGAAPYFSYFGAAAGDPSKGWYSYDVGAWHVIVLNSNCSEVGGCGSGSAQETWLRGDLQAHTNACTMAYWHHPLFSSGFHGNDVEVQTFWNDLYQYGADLVLNGHSHLYERFAPQTSTGVVDRARGIREITAGTGGAELHALGTPAPNSEVVNDTTYGVLKLALHATSYDWEFVPAAGQTTAFGDAGSMACH